MARKIVIKAISNAPEGKEEIFRLTDEWICIANEGTTTENMDGWMLLNWKPDNKQYHHFFFPPMIDHYRMHFKPGQSIFIITGSGKDLFIPAAEGSPSQYHFHLGLDKFIWNTPREKVKLFSCKKDSQKEIYELVTQREISG